MVSLAGRFGANLKRCRERRGLNRAQLAYKMEINPTSVSLFESGKRLPRMDTVIKLVAVLDCRADELIEGMAWNPGAKTSAPLKSPMSEERGDKGTQRAVLSFLLAEHPARHSVISLWWMGFGDLEAVEEAIRLLDLYGLLWHDSGAVAPTAAARHFDWLELS